jgi:hypothetical protein
MQQELTDAADQQSPAAIQVRLSNRGLELD